MLNITNLRAGYSDVKVLKDVNLSVSAGQVAVLMGPNGAGKSTVLKTIMGLLPPVAGSITWHDKDVVSIPTHELMRHGITYVPQGKINFNQLTCQENIMLGGLELSVSEKNTAYAKTLSLFPDLDAKQSVPVAHLSGGQQQMVALARALMTSPDLLLLDEPSIGLSPLLVGRVFETIKTINQQFNTTIIIVEHNIRSALSIAHHGVILVEGKVKRSAPTSTLKQDPMLEQVFVGKFD